MRKACLAVAVAIFGAMAVPTVPQAAYDPLGSGRVKLLLDTRFARFLHEAEVELKPGQGAERRGSSYVLPVTGGQIDPTEGKGEAVTTGALVFQGARRAVPLRKIRVKTKRQPLLAKVGGSQLKLARAGAIDSVRTGFGTRFRATELRLTAKVATRLNKKLRPSAPFQPGQVIGTLNLDAQPRLVAIEETGAATIDLDPGFLAKLDSRFVSLNPIAPAQRFGAQASFPIAVGGAVAPDGSEGTLRTSGSLEFLQLGAGQVFWQELWLDLGTSSYTAEVDVEPTPSFPGKIGRVGALGYAPTAVTSDSGARTIAVSGAQLALSAQAAETFNAAFAQGEPSPFAAGEAVGSLSFTARGR